MIFHQPITASILRFSENPLASYQVMQHASYSVQSSVIIYPVEAGHFSEPGM